MGSQLVAYGRVVVEDADGDDDVEDDDELNLGPWIILLVTLLCFHRVCCAIALSLGVGTVDLSVMLGHGAGAGATPTAQARALSAGLGGMSPSLFTPGTLAAISTAGASSGGAVTPGGGTASPSDNLVVIKEKLQVGIGVGGETRFERVVRTGDGCMLLKQKWNGCNAYGCFEKYARNDHWVEGGRQSVGRK